MSDKPWSWPKFIAAFGTSAAVLLGVGDQVVGLWHKLKARDAAIQQDVDTSYLDLDQRHEDDMADVAEQLAAMEARIKELERINLIDPEDIGGLKP